jgi:hypothetical protein
MVMARLNALLQASVAGTICQNFLASFGSSLTNYLSMMLQGVVDGLVAATGFCRLLSGAEPAVIMCALEGETFAR